MGVVVSFVVAIAGVKLGMAVLEIARTMGVFDTVGISGAKFVQDGNSNDSARIRIVNNLFKISPLFTR